MNSCILMAQVVSDPELRSTQDSVSVSSMIVEFESTREGEPPNQLKVEGWGNLAEDMKNSYSTGSKIIIEGRLSMNLMERNGIKEKRATLVASKIYPLGTASVSSATAPMASSSSYQAPSPTTPNNVVDFASTLQSQPSPAPATVPAATPEVTAPAADNNENWDDIPF